MEHSQILEMVHTQKLGRLFELCPAIQFFFSGIRLERLDTEETLEEALQGIADEYLEDFGLTRGEISDSLVRLMEKDREEESGGRVAVRELTVLPGLDKSGKAEQSGFTVRRGEIVAVVGPTGSGKSRLLGDIECLAQSDTPTERSILINGEIPDDACRFALGGRLISQLSQNMNFVIDLSIRDFLTMHAQSRMVKQADDRIEEVFLCANRLSGEPFQMDSGVTQLSGGQSRALMIADAAILSNSPIVLIDEIENAGIDREQAVRLLAEQEKIVFLSTHDPLLALSADRRVVIRNGGVYRVLETSRQERSNLAVIEREDRKLMELRRSIRLGGRLDFDMEAFFHGIQGSAQRT
ncbi:ATP-binding cassette domain-containing protein [Caproicibacter sp.]|uniref:ATP-binding cassette domain-containing protein n=1 Tax=Caproicibacter sp. TaxID=2814884 RepID=UPI0039893487